MDSEPYQFRAERVESVLRQAAGGAIQQYDLEDVWEDLVTDGSESAYVLTEDGLMRAATQLSAVPAFDPRYGAGHAASLESLRGTTTASM